MRRFLGLVVAAVAATVFLALSAGQALATTVHCGDVITQSVVLDADLDCSGKGLQIGGSNVTVDLNGHKITGHAPVFSGIFTPHLGDDGGTPPASIMIENGAVHGFGRGLSIDDAENVVIRNMAITGNRLGIGASHGNITKLTNSDISDNTSGGVGLNGGHTPINVSDVTIAHNGWGQGGEGLGISFIGGTITRARIVDNAFSGIGFFKGGADITDSTITGNGWQPSGSQAAQFPDLIDGIYSDEGGGVLYARNLISGNRGFGLHFLYANPSIVSNTITDNGLGGIDHVLSGHVRGNAVDRNGGDGIVVVPPNPFTTNPFADISNNHVWFNAGVGIKSAEGTSGSGNWVKHNAAGQCTGTVQCSTTGKPKG
jgi:hypothetical protein